MKYFALRYVPLAKVFKTVVAELDTVVDASAISEWLKLAPAVPKDSTPNPFVFKNCPDDPSDVGKVNPLIVTPPVPLPESSKLEFEAFADTVLSVIVTPSMVIDVFAVKVVKVPAAAVDPPIYI